jgi:DNA-directed RNA polymerase subunit RPC12/RpoP
MNSVECPKCTLHFEPDEFQSAARTDIFCPQCGHKFPMAPLPAATANTSVNYQTA